VLGGIERLSLLVRCSCGGIVGAVRATEADMLRCFCSVVVGGATPARRTAVGAGEQQQLCGCIVEVVALLIWHWWSGKESGGGSCDGGRATVFFRGDGGANGRANGGCTAVLAGHQLQGGMMEAVSVTLCC